MITSRGWWFLLVALSILALGALNDRWTISLFALTLLFWFGWEWLLFMLRLRLAIPATEVLRTIHDGRGAVDTLWAGRNFSIRVEIESSHWLGLPFVRVDDLIPFAVATAFGKTQTEGALGEQDRLALSYSIRCTGAGLIRFEGVGFQVADPQGFFYQATVLGTPQVCRVLPALADAEGKRPAIKRSNLLPSPGLHRHMRPGSGSELLDLRDYLPGDPPKTIAWKISARRDRLITKEFESEVPLRCTLFVDTSQSVRVGFSGRNALSRIVEITAAVAQATAAARDLAGLCLFDEESVGRYIRPARSQRHLIEMLNVLADVAGLAPTSGEARLPVLLPLAFAFVQEAQPELIRSDVNHLASWKPWIWSLKRYTKGRFRIFRLVMRVLFFGSATLPILAMLVVTSFFTEHLLYFANIVLPVPWPVVLLLIGGYAVAFLAVYYRMLGFGYRMLTQVFSAERRRLVRMRKFLAAILSEHYDLAPQGMPRLMEDDAGMVHHLEKYLAEHHVPYPLPLYDRQGRYIFASAGKVEVLAKAMLQAVGKGRDNELFVLLVDLLEVEDQLTPLLKAVKVTLARHHHVIVVCPWPPGVAAPGGPKEGISKKESRVDAMVRQSTVARLHAAFARMRHRFARLGVSVICAAGTDPVPLILDRLDRLRARGMGRKR